MYCFVETNTAHTPRRWTSYLCCCVNQCSSSSILISPCSHNNTHKHAQTHTPWSNYKCSSVAHHPSPTYPSIFSLSHLSLSALLLLPAFVWFILFYQLFFLQSLSVCPCLSPFLFPRKAISKRMVIDFFLPPVSLYLCTSLKAFSSYLTYPFFLFPVLLWSYLSKEGSYIVLQPLWLFSRMQVYCYCWSQVSEISSQVFEPHTWHLKAWLYSVPFWHIKEDFVKQKCC